MDDFNQQLSLVVLNSEQLDGSQQVQYRFDEMGGTLGASEQDDWQLRDRLGSVMPAHARIELNDGRFCLCDLSGQTYINGATSPIGRARKVHLEQGDELIVGPFRMRAYLGAISPEQNLHQVLGNRPSEQLDEWLAGEETSQAMEDPRALAVDPLLALQHERSVLTPLVDPRQPSPLRSQPDMDAVSLAPFSAVENTMNQEFLDMPTIENHPDYHPPLEGVDHVALTPLMRGLGQSLQLQDTQQAHDMLEEMGKTVRAMVEGLLQLQTEQAALADKHLRPIEDNPLRLGLDYDETLRNVRIHHVANQQAIGAALDSILQAFSPEALIGRFEHYRRTGAPGVADEGWAWNMYQHYYRELTSARQQGFDKLFHQVYAQAYDQAVRQQQGLI
ncbi:TPA: type VI secretion system-associated FHA domain protein TagH [Aeromonas salmonicida]|uniref:type VI secretion system-associated FHA domain protein TagH n=1 Tax=Aeromonas salmonicida TaxID=645 RepID=UPI000450A142|nr:type VI secretion system-associated FHA domain protein TagH [Aeromonas salmonicida]ELM3745166.1 type VI secretion system-associated FHA domain protein TagH [Aeromonas salmonicida subsp. salmonicida]ASI23741.1 type VI secretion protein [Aeromonas salmonicida]ASI28060.1 type VI secretion protein [Aeromonas salmonicida]ASI32192.1 type VI secretion protein [Aeromonas salmonicida]ATD38702.1 type VI secretion protein [Aeromonas salmonicida subsp. masoucida]